MFVAAKLLAASADASLEHIENADVVVTHALGQRRDYGGWSTIIIGQACGRTFRLGISSSTR